MRECPRCGEKEDIDITLTVFFCANCGRFSIDSCIRLYRGEMRRQDLMTMEELGALRYSFHVEEKGENEHKEEAEEDRVFFSVDKKRLKEEKRQKNLKKNRKKKKDVLKEEAEEDKVFFSEDEKRLKEEKRQKNLKKNRKKKKDVLKEEDSSIEELLNTLTIKISDPQEISQFYTLYYLVCLTLLKSKNYKELLDDFVKYRSVVRKTASENIKEYIPLLSKVITDFNKEKFLPIPNQWLGHKEPREERELHRKQEERKEKERIRKDQEALERIADEIIERERIKKERKSTINGFIKSLTEFLTPKTEEGTRADVFTVETEDKMRLAETARINKYRRNSFDLTDDGRFLSMATWDSRATYDNLIYPVLQTTYDKCENENVYLPETFNAFINNLDFSKISDPSEFASVSEKLRQLYEIRDLLKNAGKNKSEKYKKFRDGKLKQIFKLFTELGRLLKPYNDLPYAQNGVQVAMDVRNDLKSYLRNLEEWNNEKDEIERKIRKQPYLRFNLRERPRLPRYKPKQSEYRVVYPKQLFESKTIKDKIKVREIKYKNYSKRLIDIPIPISRSNKKYKKLGRKYLVEKVTFRYDMFDDMKDFWERFRQIRIIPKGTYYNVELVYKPEREKADIDPSRVLAIDFNQCNLLTFTDNIGNRPRIIGGGIIKKANYLLHSQCSELQSLYTIPKSLIDTKLRTKDPILDLINKRKEHLEQYIKNRKKKKGEKYNPHLIKLYEKQSDLQKEVNMYQKQRAKAERKLRTVSTQTEKNELEFEISILVHD
ncbi:MAG: hypothetical protein ACOC5T_06930, partial [Elusimicrobiota bacterium]